MATGETRASGRGIGGDFRKFWVGQPISNLGGFFNINTVSLCQAIVPDRMLGRVQSIARVLAWSAIPAGALLGGLAIERTGNVALVYGVVGVLVFFTALSFSFSALGRAERYLPEREEKRESGTIR